MEKEKIIRALEELRKEKKRNFSQSIDLIINLKDFDMKKDTVNLFVQLPHKIKDAKICAFLNEKSPSIETVIKDEFAKYKDKKKAKALAKKYDFFIASASVMPQVAAVFGKYLGPMGKMPSPQMGIITEETEDKIKEVSTKYEKIVRVKSKEPSLKISIGKDNMKDDDISRNIIQAYNTILNALPREKENIKSVIIKLTMSKPIRIE